MKEDQDNNIIIHDNSDIYNAIKKKNELLDAHCHKLYLEYKYKVYCDSVSEKNRLSFEEYLKNKEDYRMVTITDDNSQLEELIKEKINPQVKQKILEILHDSRLFLPVIFRKSRDSSDLGGQFGFDIVDIPDGYGQKTVPLFTSSEIAESNPLKYTTIAVTMADLAEMLKQTDRYASVTINIFTQSFFELPLDEFLDIFGIVANHRIKDIKNEKLRQLLQNDFTEDELYQEINDLPLITPWVDEEQGPAYEVTYDKNDNLYVPLFTDLDEFKMVFGNDNEVYPQAYTFSRYVEFLKDDLVINPATESVAIHLKDLKDKSGSFDNE